MGLTDVLPSSLVQVTFPIPDFISAFKKAGWGGSAERALVPVLESLKEPPEGAGVGWQRAVGVREAIGEGALPLAGSAGWTVYCHAARGTGNAGQRAGPGRSAAAQELVAACAGCIKHFFRSMCEKHSQ
jgi:hypothetical protein